MMSIFSERLKELRKEKGLTQKELANKVNMGQGGYTHTGKLVNVSQILIKLNYWQDI